MQRTANQPPIDGAMSFVISAWRSLHGERPVWGNELGPIPYSAFGDWAADHECDAELTQLLREAIEKLDGDRSREQRAKSALNTRTGGK